MPDPVAAYARSVLAGKVPAGRLVKLAAERHLRDLKDGPKLGLRWDARACAHALQFFGFLRLPGEGSAGKPFALEPFQEFILGSLFGWKSADGARRFRTAYVEVGKGNGKTPVAAGVGLYGLVADGEPAAEVYSAATTAFQAGILFRDAKLMAEASPALAGRLEVGQHNLAFPATNSFLRPVSSEHRQLSGPRPHMALIDEIHEHRDSLVVDKMRAGTKSRRQAIIFEITNSGFDRNSVCWRHHEYSRQVLEGVVRDDSWFAFVCGLDPCPTCRGAGALFPREGCADCDDWRDERTWPKANPGLGTILPAKYLREQVREAVGMPAKANIVKRLNFCVWTEQSERAIDLDLWDRGAAPVDEAALAGRPCYGGLDLARVQDLSALCLLFPPLSEGEPWQALLRFWVPEDDIEVRGRRDRVPYDLWRRQGFLRATPGNTTDFGYIREEIISLAGRFDLRELAYDHVFAGEIVQALQDEGLSLVGFGQGFLSMAAPTAELLRLLKAGRLRHGGHPVLRWNAANLSLRQDPAGNLKPDKEKSQEKIDGIVALLMALGRALVGPDLSAADDPGVLVIEAAGRTPGAAPAEDEEDW